MSFITRTLARYTIDGDTGGAKVCGRGWQGIKGSCKRAAKGTGAKAARKQSAIELANKVRAERGLKPLPGQSPALAQTNSKAKSSSAKTQPVSTALRKQPQPKDDRTSLSALRSSLKTKAEVQSNSSDRHDPVADRKALEALGGRKMEIDSDLKTLSRLDPKNKAESLYRKAILDPSFSRDGAGANDGNLSSLDRTRELFRIHKNAVMTDDYADEAGDFLRQGVRGTKGGTINAANIALGQEIYTRLNDKQKDIFAAKVNPDHQHFKGEKVDKKMFDDIRKRREKLLAKGEFLS